MKKTTQVLLVLAVMGTAWFTFSSFTTTDPNDPKAQDLQNVYLGAYSVLYSQQFEQPVEVSYIVDCAVPELDRKGRNFKSSPYDIKTSDNEDYKDNVWDKGHLAPAASFACNEAQFNQTFYWLNCALQHEALNRGPWKEVEEFERDLAKVYDTVRVDILCDFPSWCEVLETGATVPDAFRRHIQFGDQEVWLYFPNDSTVKGKDWSEFKTKLRRFEPSLKR
jgi:DNA/RNA endonuclease G (NUC1)